MEKDLAIADGPGLLFKAVEGSNIRTLRSFYGNPLPFYYIEFFNLCQGGIKPFML